MTSLDPEKVNYSYDRATSTPIIRAVLKGGEALRPLQRAGVVVVSLMILLWGVGFAIDALNAIENNSPRYLPFGALALSLIVFGLLGVRNALRFKRPPS